MIRHCRVCTLLWTRIYGFLLQPRGDLGLPVAGIFSSSTSAHAEVQPLVLDRRGIVQRRTRSTGIVIAVDEADDLPSGLLLSRLADPLVDRRLRRFVVTCQRRHRQAFKCQSDPFLPQFGSITLSSHEQPTLGVLSCGNSFPHDWSKVTKKSYTVHSLGVADRSSF